MMALLHRKKFTSLLTQTCQAKKPKDKIFFRYSPNPKVLWLLVSLGRLKLIIPSLAIEISKVSRSCPVSSVWVSKVGTTLERDFQIFSVLNGVREPCAVFPTGMRLRLALHGRDQRCAGVEAGPKRTERDLLSAETERRRCLFLIPSVRLLTSDDLSSGWHRAGLLFVGGMSHVSKLLVMSVDTVSALPSLVLWQWLLKSRTGRTRDLPSTFVPGPSYF